MRTSDVDGVHFELPEDLGYWPGNHAPRPQRTTPRRLPATLGVSLARWREPSVRFLRALGPGLVVVSALLVLIGRGDLPASLQVTGQDVTLTADRLEAGGYSRTGRLVLAPDHTRQTALLTRLEGVRLTGVCESVRIPTPLGEFTVRAAAPGRTVSARRMTLPLESLSGTVTLTGARAGADTGAGAGDEQANRITVTQLSARARWASTGTVPLAGLGLSAGPWTRECAR